MKSEYDILNTLSIDKPMGFNEIQRESGVSSVTLSRYLAQSGGTVKKTDDGKYVITPEGLARRGSHGGFLSSDRYSSRRGEHCLKRTVTHTVGKHILLTLQVETKEPLGLVDVIISKKAEILAKGLVKEMQVMSPSHVTGISVFLAADLSNLTMGY